MLRLICFSNCNGTGKVGVKAKSTFHVAIPFHHLEEKSQLQPSKIGHELLPLGQRIELPNPPIPDPAFSALCDACRCALGCPITSSASQEIRDQRP